MITKEVFKTFKVGMPDAYAEIRNILKDLLLNQSHFPLSGGVRFTLLYDKND